MGSKKEGVFRGEPKGSSVSLPKIVKKQTSSREVSGLDVCQGFRWKGYTILI